MDSRSADLIALAEPIARRFFGEPNRRLSNKAELRFGTKGSVSVDLRKGTWFDHEADQGGGVIDLIKRETGLHDAKECLEWAEREGYWTNGRAKPNGGAGHHTSRLGKEVAVYDYVDETGEKLFQVVRYDPKGFRQRKPNGHGEWDWNVTGVRQVPYRLPELIEALSSERIVFITEGEKDADNMWKVGMPATTNAGGVGKWRTEYNQVFTGADVIVIADNDPQAHNPKTGELLFHEDGRPKLPGQDHAYAVAAELSGKAARVRVLDLGKHWKDCPPKGDISNFFETGHTVERLNDIVGQLRDWSPPATGLDEWDAGDDPGPISPRQWLLGNQFCRSFISSIVAAGGTGKSALGLLQFISLATGLPLCGQHVFRRCRILLISLEDDKNEMERRIKAVLDYYKIDRAELKGWLFCASPKLAKLAEMKNRTRIIGPLEQQVRDAIARRHPDVISLDPFIKTHGLEENDSGDMDFVCDLLARMAVEYNIAVDSPHHVHKGQLTPGDANSGRGSSGIKDAGRLVYTLTVMSADEANAFNIDPDDRYSYIRLNSAKTNLTVRSGKATWFRLIGVPINNGTEEYPNGDTIQAVEPWSPPSTWADTTVETLNRILNDIAQGMPNGQRYSTDNAAKNRAVWLVVQKHCPQKSKAQCREIIQAWVNSGLIYTEPYEDPTDYKERSGVYVDDTKRPL